MSYESELRVALKRLEASDTQLKRFNARKNLRLLLSGIKRECEKRYPLLNQDGTEKKGRRRVLCPICDVPMKNFSSLASHIILKHKQHRATTSSLESSCWCGKRFHTGQNQDYKAMATAFARHLAGIRDLKAHALLGALKSQ